MELNKIVIEKLFNKYDVCIDMQNECTILIGPNGIGKSTILHILHCLFKQNFIDIAAYPFGAIEMYFGGDNDEETKIIKYEYAALFPSQESIISSYGEYCRRMHIDNLRDPDFAIDPTMDVKRTTEDKMANLQKCVLELQDKGLYGVFIYNLYMKKIQPLNVLEIVKKHCDYRDLEKANIVFQSALSYVKTFSDSVIENLVIRNQHIGYETEKEERESYYCNLVENIALNNARNVKAIYEDEEITWMLEGKKKFFISNEFIREKLLREYSDDFFLSYKENAKQIFLKVQKQNIFDINVLMGIHYYDIETVTRINNIAVKCLCEHLDKGDKGLIGDEHWFISQKEEDRKAWISRYEEAKKFYTKEVVRDFNELILPIMIKGSFFDQELNVDFEHNLYDYKNEENIDGNIDKERQAYKDSEAVHNLGRIETMRDFLEEALPIVRNPKNRSDLINKYQNGLENYFYDKKIEITPAGITLRDQNDSVIDLSVVSSGERKIMYLLAVSIFLGGIIFMDEPELSLALPWQERLIPDMLDVGKIKNLFVATHSPFIAHEEALERYLTYLPQQ